MDKKKVFVVLVSAFVIMICLTYQGTYSYFTATVEGTGNRENNESTGQTDTLENLILSEGSNVVSNAMIPGDSVTYRFTVQNPNNIDVCFNLLWSNTSNTFINQKDLVVKLEKSDGTVLVNNKQFPATNSGTTELLLGSSIKANTTETYTLTVTYLNTDEDQTADMDKSFSGTIIGELGECVRTAAETILLKGETDELKFDNTVDNNLRYVGADPNNYVSFNNEIWRIIGAFNNIDDGTGTKETRLKIIRDEPIGNYSWDYDASGNYDNDWSTSTLMDLLNNGAYYNRTTGSYYNNSTTVTSVDFSSNGLTEEAKIMISNTKWNIGGLSGSSSDENYYPAAISSAWYTYERGTTVYNGRPTEWTGKIGLIYPSDYGYATSGGSGTDRNTCLNTELYNWNSISVIDCKNNDWLYDSSNTRWTLTPNSNNSNYMFTVDSFTWAANNNPVNISNAVFPALYLSSNVKITGGDGSEGNPFELSL